MTDFPDKIKIRTIDRKSKKPLSGILLTIRLFAKHKNDYYYTTELSNDDGEIMVTKQDLKEEITRTIISAQMDFASSLENCKPIIEIEAEGSETLTKRIKKMEEYISVYPENLQRIAKAKASNNWSIVEKKKTVKIKEGKEMQEIILELQLMEK